jgi:hypothetical protein
MECDLEELGGMLKGMLALPLPRIPRTAQHNIAFAFLSRAWRLCLILGLSWIQSGCESSPTVNKASEPTYALKGRLVLPASNSQTRDTLYLRPADWTLSTPYSSRRWLLLDTTGTFCFNQVPSGTWRLDFQRAPLLWSRILVVQHDTTLPDATPRLGSMLHIPLRQSDSSRGGLLYLYGQELFAHIPDTGDSAFLSLGPIPAGQHTLLQTRWNGAVIQEAHVWLSAGSEDTLPTDAWHPCCQGPRLDTLANAFRETK